MQNTDYFEPTQHGHSDIKSPQSNRQHPLPIFDLSSKGDWPEDVFGSDGMHLAPKYARSKAFQRPTAEPIDVDGLYCRCTECDAPLSVRTWLLTVDCWNCRTSLLVGELQKASLARTSMAPSTSSKNKVLHREAAHPRQLSESAFLNNLNQIDSRPPARTFVRHRRSLVRPLGDMPAWLSSLLLHLLLLIILALLSMRSEIEDDVLTLSTNVSTADIEDVESFYVDPVDNTIYDLPVPEADQPRTERQRKALILADKAAQEIRMDPEDESPDLPDLFALKRAIGTDPDQRTFAVRDPRIRVEMIRREGGTTLSEAAVARGLLWMAQHQNADGSWSLNRFHRAGSCNGRCQGGGHIKSDSAGTSLCLLPFLGAGQTHFTGKYRDVVATGLRWLIDHQQENGDLRAGTRGTAGMYAHGQAAIVLCEAYALTKDESLRQPAQNAIDFIVQAQHRRGGWRYSPGEPGDTSVLGWQLMALQSAKVAGLDVPESALAKAGRYLDSCQHLEGALYGYQPGREPTHVMTAEALLCRMYLGWKLDNRALRVGVNILANKALPTARQFNIYYWYYGTQVQHHVGGRSWRRWNQRVRDILVDTQVKYGHEAGSWDPEGPHGSHGGRLYVTSLAVCTLEVYYRHAPIFRQLGLE